MCRHEQSRYRTSIRFDTEPDSSGPLAAAGTCSPSRKRSALSLRFWLSCSLCILPVAANAQSVTKTETHHKRSDIATKKKPVRPLWLRAVASKR